METAALPYFPASAVLGAVCLAFGLDVETLRGMGNQPSVCMARNAAALLLREHTALSNVELSHALGRTDCTTGRHNLNRGILRRTNDPRFAATLDHARQRLVEGLHHV